MLGIICDVLAVALGGASGAMFGKFLSDEFREKLNMVFGACAMGMGITTTILMQNMPAVVLALVVGSCIGMALSFERRISSAGNLLQKPVRMLLGSSSQGESEDREEFINLLVTAMVLFCSSSTGIYGSLDAGMTGDSTILISKAILDFFTAVVFSCSLGPVVSVIALPQFIVFTVLFALSKLILPLTDPVMIADFKACGGIMLVATGLRMAGVKNFPIADMIPALILVMPLSSLWAGVIVPLL